MDYDRLRSITLELRMLTGIIAKTSREAMQQRLAANQIELSSLQVGLLHMLSHHGAQTISEISKLFMLDPSTLVPTIDSLERKGYVLRQRDPNDRRRVPISLTEAGTALIHEISMVGDDDPILVSLQEMGQDDAEKLVELARSLVSHLKEGEEILENVQTRMKRESRFSHHEQWRERHKEQHQRWRKRHTKRHHNTGEGLCKQQQEEDPDAQ